MGRDAVLRLVGGRKKSLEKPRAKVTPVYPELAKRMNIRGVVRVQVTVAPNGSIKDAKLVGGHPVLANAALDAVKKWRFETAPARDHRNCGVPF